MMSIKHSSLKYVLLVLLLSVLSSAHAQNDYKWFIPQHAEGICQQNADHKFYRLPGYMHGQVRDVVWQLGTQSAGEFIRFKTVASKIMIQYVLSAKRLNMPHMPATGVSGLDLYAVDKNNCWYWVSPSYHFGDTCSYTYENLDQTLTNDMQFYLFLPLYNGVDWLRIGIANHQDLTFCDDVEKLPVIAYGTSIMQGAVASRPGLAWTNILERRLHIPVYNLGFSGNGKLEKPIFELMAKTPAQMYIIDCLPNLTDAKTFTLQEMERRLEAGIRILRKKHPLTPILLTEAAGSHITLNLSTTKRKSYEAVNRKLDSFYTSALNSGETNLYLLRSDEINFDANSTVEGTHPDDIGMLQYADAYEKKIRSILSGSTPGGRDAPSFKNH